MKRKRLLALLISAVFIAQPTTYVLAEKNQSTNDVENSVNEKSEDEAEEKSETQEVEERDEEDNNDSNTQKENVQGVVGGYIPSDLDYNAPVYHNKSRARRAAVNIPSVYPSDMNTFKATYPQVRNQNPYGTCWAFSSLGLAEFDLINDSLCDGTNKYNSSIDLSELQLAYFNYNFVQDPLGGTEGDTAEYYNENATENYLDYGGNYEMATRRLGQWISAVDESIVPYANASTVLANGLDSSYAYNNVNTHLENVYRINIKENPSDVKQEIMEHGAVGVMYQHTWSGVNYNNSTYYDTDYSGGGHAVMVVGWDDSFSKDKFNGTSKPSADGAWLVRNSWGTGSGNFDYFWMSYESTSLSDTAWVFDFSADDGYDNNYQLDGGLDSWQYTGSNTVANIFTVPNREAVDSESLKAVSVSFTKKANVDYTIDVYTGITKDYYYNPVSGTKSATVSGTTKYAGVYTIPLEEEVKLTPGTTYSVVVTMSEPAMDCESAKDTVQDINANPLVYVWKNRVSYYDNYKYKSYAKVNNAYTPCTNNFRIKAFTSNNVETKHSINYELNGGTNNSENQETYTSGNGTIVLKDPTREGCIFEGWYTDKDYTNKITEIPANAAQDYTLYAKWSSVTGEKLAGYNLNLDGTIGVNFFVELPNNVVVSKDAYMEFTLPNGDKSQVSVKKAKRSGSYYIFTARVKAQEMTKDIKAKMVVGNQSGKVYTYSVKQYADYILNHTNAYTEAGVKVVKGLLNYGAATQQLFSYNLDNLANESMSDSDKLIEDVDFSQYKYSVINDPDVTGIKYYGSLLNLNTSTNVKNYFRLDEDHSIDEYQFSYKIGNEEKEVAPVLSEQQGVQCYLIEIKDVKAYNLDQQPVVIIRMKNNEETEGMQLIYGAFSYAEAVSRLSTPNENLVNLTKALYWYWYGARLYADEQNK